MSIEFSESTDGSLFWKQADCFGKVGDAIPEQPITSVEKVAEVAAPTDGEQVWSAPEKVRRAVGAAAAEAETAPPPHAQAQDGAEDAASESDETKNHASEYVIPPPEPTTVAVAGSGGDDKPPIKRPPAPGAAEPDEPNRSDPTHTDHRPEHLDAAAAGEREEVRLVTDAQIKKIVFEGEYAIFRSSVVDRTHIAGTFTSSTEGSLRVVGSDAVRESRAAELEVAYQTAADTIRFCQAYRDANNRFDKDGPAQPVYIVDERHAAHPDGGGFVRVQHVYESPDIGVTRGPELATKTTVFVEQVGDKDSLYATIISRGITDILATSIIALTPEQEAVYLRCEEVFSEDSLAALIAQGEYPPGPELETALAQLQQAAYEVGVYPPSEIDDIVAKLREVAPAVYADRNRQNGLRTERLAYLKEFMEGFDRPGLRPKPWPEVVTPPVVTPRMIIALASQAATGESPHLRTAVTGVVDEFNRPNFYAQEPTVNRVTGAEEDSAEHSAEWATTILHTLQTSPACRVFGITERTSYAVEDRTVYWSRDQGYVKVQKIYETGDNGVAIGDAVVTATMVKVPSQDHQETLHAIFFSREGVSNIVGEVDALVPAQEEVRARCAEMFGVASIAVGIASGEYGPGEDLDTALEHFRASNQAVGVYSDAEIEAVAADLREAALLAYASKNASLNTKDIRLERVFKFVQSLHS